MVRGFSQIVRFILAKAIFIIPFYPLAKANGNEGKTYSKQIIP
jgi:hypothetical protein